MVCMLSKQMIAYLTFISESSSQVLSECVCVLPKEPPPFSKL